MSDNGGYTLDGTYPAPGKRVTNRIGLSEVDEDGALWLSHGKVYSCTGAAYSKEEAEGKQ